MAKELAQTSIVTVVSFDGSSSDAYKIVMRRTDGSMATLTTLAVITKAGMTYIQRLDLNRMLELNGRLETEVKTETGGKTKKVQHENR
jgi:hypothetical protein